MNDTETEARRLLAAGAEDMPPGIDLLGGFAAARRRGQVRRMRGRVVLSAGVAVAASSVTAVALSLGSAPSALATVTGAMTSTLGQSYHVTELDSIYYVVDGRQTSPSRDACTSESDPVRNLVASSCSQGLSIREVGGYAYIYITDPVGHAGRHWWRTPIASLSSGGLRTADGGVLSATPQQMLAQIEKADKATVAGPVSGPGWTGTRYAFTSGPRAGTTVSGTADVDQQGRARALMLTIRSSSQAKAVVFVYDLSFSDFGVPVTVTPPPADQTFSGP